MDWIFDNFQVVVFLVIVLVSLAKRILDSKREAAEEEDTTIEDWAPPPPRRQPVGPPPLGRTSTPPPLQPGSGKITPRVVGRSAPVAAIPVDAPSALQRQQEMMDRLRQAKLEKEQRAKMAAAQRSSGKSGGMPVSPGGVGLRGLLRQRGEARRAVVLREILGPPVGMR